MLSVIVAVIIQGVISRGLFFLLHFYVFNGKLVERREPVTESVAVSRAAVCGGARCLVSLL